MFCAVPTAREITADARYIRIKIPHVNNKLVRFAGRNGGVSCWTNRRALSLALIMIMIYRTQVWLVRKIPQKRLEQGQATSDSVTQLRFADSIAL